MRFNKFPLYTDQDRFEPKVLISLTEGFKPFTDLTIHMSKFSIFLGDDIESSIYVTLEHTSHMSLKEKIKCICEYILENDVLSKNNENN